MNKKTPFIVLEGGEGAGKSTQIARLKKTYPNSLFTREPGGSPYAEEIRNLLLHSEHAAGAPAVTKLLLFFTGRADHLKRWVLPALEKGIPVITDRFDSSSFAYQLFGEQEHELESLFLLLRQEIVSLCPPDLYIYLEIGSQEGLDRKQVQSSKGEEKLNHFDKAALDFHERMREGYEKFFSMIPQPMKRINAADSVESVFLQIVSLIDPLLR